MSSLVLVSSDMEIYKKKKKKKTTPLFQFEILRHVCPHVHTHTHHLKRHNILLSFKPSIHVQMAAVPFFSSVCWVQILYRIHTIIQDYYSLE